LANISVGRLDFPKVSTQPVEIVERKGTGHPDTICDALGEKGSLLKNLQWKRHING